MAILTDEDGRLPHTLHLPSTASTSPSSTRYPSHLHLPVPPPHVLHPPVLRVPPKVSRPVHPLPPPPYGSGTNRSAVLPLLPLVPSRHPCPRRVQLPRHPHRHHPQLLVQHVHPRFPPTGRPINTAPSSPRPTSSHVRVRRVLRRPVQVVDPLHPRPPVHLLHQPSPNASPARLTTSTLSRHASSSHQLPHRRRHRVHQPHPSRPSLPPPAPARSPPPPPAPRGSAARTPRTPTGRSTATSTPAPRPAAPARTPPRPTAATPPRSGARSPPPSAGPSTPTCTARTPGSSPSSAGPPPPAPPPQAPPPTPSGTTPSSPRSTTATGAPASSSM